MRRFRFALMLASVLAISPAVSSQTEAGDSTAGKVAQDVITNPHEPLVTSAPTRSPSVGSSSVLIGSEPHMMSLDPGSTEAVGSRQPRTLEAAQSQNSASYPPADWIPSWPEVARSAGGVVARRQVIAFYGHPSSTLMGVLGESPIEEMAEDLFRCATEYDALNGEIGVAPAFHIIYGTVHPDASIGIINETKLMEYIEFAEQRGIIVFLDHQIGRYSVAEAIDSMLPYLAFNHVHLALDPEWATTRPGEVIGQIEAQDLNLAQESISNFLIANDIDGPRMLVVHQFSWRMIANRHLVRTDYRGVQLIHNADGFGEPEAKYRSWEFNVQASNMPLKGFKLFFPKSWRDGGYDDPLLSPIEVLQLSPVPVYIQYQ